MAKQPDYEIPKDMRDFAERSVDQVRKAFDGFMDAAYKATGAIEGSSDVVQTSARDVGRKAMSYAEQNVSAALDLASRVVSARTPHEILALQAEFVRTQAAAFNEQARDLGISAAELAKGFAKSKK